MRLSIVATLYRSGPYVEEFYRRASLAAGRLTDDYEIVLVDDGSPDDSLDLALGLRGSHPEVCVVELSRNFGHHKAMMTGLAHATGDLVYLTDCDLEEAPELLVQFHETMIATDSDVVYGVQESRKGGAFERLSGDAFYWAINAMSYYPVPKNLVTARLMTRQYVASLVEHRDREVFMAGLWAITGYRQLAMPIQKGSKGQTSYNLRRKISIAVNSVTSFSYRPLVWIFYLGCMIVVLALCIASYFLYERATIGKLFPGWLSLIVSIWILGGLTIGSLGVIGIYLAKVFMEVKDRPYTVERSVHPSSSLVGAGSDTSETQ
jgi:putative glycosyltransferase